ncbi:MAG: MarR family transcriptional regulator [Fusobacteriaceae bacterium]|nr:MarR family transcriptional regulator [Fusobacteriaceae bacterium]MBN2837478.1 MarR family transcriptional regulator [Fusobacteriaceae bacterium]
MYKEIGESFGSISRRTDSIFRKRCKDSFISKGLISYLIIIYENPGIIADEVSNILRIHKGATARALAKLESKNYIIRIKDSLDKRKYKLFATEKSNDLCEELVNVYYEIARESISILEVEEQEILLNILKKIRIHVKNIDSGDFE